MVDDGHANDTSIGKLQELTRLDLQALAACKKAVEALNAPDNRLLARSLARGQIVVRRRCASADRVKRADERLNLVPAAEPPPKI